MIPRVIRLNNPGNIEHGAPWEGLDPRNRDPRFCGFVSPEYGIRAIVRVLITYYDKRRARDGSRIDTVREIVERWAPAGENNTEAYAKHEIGRESSRERVWRYVEIAGATVALKKKKK